MNKNRIRLTESQLHRVIKESIKKVLKEPAKLKESIEMFKELQKKPRSRCTRTEIMANTLAWYIEDSQIIVDIDNFYIVNDDDGILYIECLCAPNIETASPGYIRAAKKQFDNAENKEELAICKVDRNIKHLCRIYCGLRNVTTELDCEIIDGDYVVRGYINLY